MSHVALTPACKAQVSAGKQHTLLRSSNGQVYACGSNERGQLGCEGAASLAVPHAVPLPPASLAVAAGDHCIAVCGAAAGMQPPQSRSADDAVVTCNSPLPIPDLLTLAREAKGQSQTGAAGRAHIAKLVDGIRAVFSSPGVLIAGFSLPPRPRPSQELDSSGQLRDAPPSHMLDTDAIIGVFEAIMRTLESDIVLALRATIIALLQSIEERELQARDTNLRSVKAQMQWLKVRRRSLCTDCSWTLHCQCVRRRH